MMALITATVLKYRLKKEGTINNNKTGAKTRVG